MTAPLRVLLADDHAPTRTGVRMALEAAGHEVCAEAADAPSAVAAALRERPDVCVLDVEMPGGGIRAASDVTAQLPGTQVLMLTVSSRGDDLCDALRAGARSYVLKDTDPRRLARAVEATAEGDAVLSGVLTLRLVEELRRVGGRAAVTLDAGRTASLTPREWEVLDLMIEGLSTSRIAKRLALSPVTVRRHLSLAMDRLGVSSREEARRLLADAAAAGIPTDGRSSA